jgi:hypothetical protein
MAIQFHCSNCGQPIEVDDQYAGRAAGCPYCKAVVTAPPNSTFEPGAVSPARPAGGPFPDRTEGFEGPPSVLPPPLPSAPPLDPRAAERERAAATWGRFSLISGTLGLALLAAAMVVGFVKMSPRIAQLQRENPNAALQDIMKQLESTPGVGITNALSCGAMFFSLVGLSLSIVSLVQSRRNNWRGWAGLLLGLTPVICFCGSVVLLAALATAGGV